MEQIKTYMGEVVDATSPSIQEAIDNASFGKYSYDPMSRMQVSLPGWQGYSTSQNPQGFYQQQPMGYIGQAMTGYNYGLGMNPYMYQQQQQQVPQQPNYVQIPPLNYRGDYLPPMNFEETLDKLSAQFWMKEQEQAVQRNNNGYGFGYNYYGNMFYNYSNPVVMEANNIVHKMQQQASENRINFNIQLGKLAYNLTYGKGNYDEAKLEELYRGKVIENPLGVQVDTLKEQARMASLVPFDNSAYYQAYQAQVTAQHNAIIPPDSNMVEAFNRSGELWATYMMEEEMHRRRNLASAYDSNGYKYFIRKCIAERNNVDGNRFNGQAIAPMLGGNGIPAPGTMNVYTSNPRNGGSHVTSIPSIDSQGNMNLTLSIPCNFGSMKGSTYTVNEKESAYDKKREEFNRFVDSIPKSIYQLESGGG